MDPDVLPVTKKIIRKCKQLLTTYCTIVKNIHTALNVQVGGRKFHIYLMQRVKELKQPLKTRFGRLRSSKNKILIKVVCEI